jgi:hypothetical protein
MNNQGIDELKSISIKAGDILVTQTKSCSSFLIRGMTASKWSHVGIAVDKEFVLEAVKGRGNSADSQPQVRVVPLNVFAANTTARRHYIRPEKLSPSRIEKLNAFAALNNETGYTAIHAAITAFIPIMRIAFSIIAIISMFDIWSKAEPSEVLTPSFIFSALIIIGIIYLLYRLLSWSFRSDWCVKTTEDIYRKCSLGNWLVEIKYEMFCSKLVLLADLAVSGPLGAYVPNENEIQPKHVAEACKKLGWKAVDV